MIVEPKARCLCCGRKMRYPSYCSALCGVSHLGRKGYRKHMEHKRIKYLKRRAREAEKVETDS